MAKEVERIADQFDRAISGDAWHGPSVMTILDGITAQDAAAPTVNNAHSIWELVLHITAWQRTGLRRLRGEKAQLSDAEDWPPINDASEAAWERSKSEIKQSSDEFREAIVQLEDDVLDAPIAEGMSTTYVTLHGVVQHTLYHAGQIAILKKALSANEGGFE